MVVVLKIFQIKNWLKNCTNQSLEKSKVHSSFEYNTWSADLVDMQLVSKSDKKCLGYSFKR